MSSAGNRSTSDAEYWEYTPNPKRVWVPPEKLDECVVCGCTDGKLQVCGSCGEVIYCSRECQQKQWPQHKRSCGKTERLDIRHIYPFIAVLFELGVVHPDRPLHPALEHIITNSPSPDPGAPLSKLPDGSLAKVVVLGDKIEFDGGTSTWWPGAASDRTRYKLYQRIIREGMLLPNYFAICMSILAEVYTTTSLKASESPRGKAEPRIRLMAYGSPLSDFGIVRGSMIVPPTNRLAYYNSKDRTFRKGQDPKEHYWLYFKTIRGEEYGLDCGMGTFDMTEMVMKPELYLQDVDLPFKVEPVPASWRGKSSARTRPEWMFIAEKHFSFLREPRLQWLVGGHGLMQDRKTLAAFSLLMNEFSGKDPYPLEEKTYGLDLAIQYCIAWQMIKKREGWKKWPEQVPIGIINDPEGGEIVHSAEEDEYLEKLLKQVNKGKISKEEMFSKYQAYCRGHQ